MRSWCLLGLLVVMLFGMAGCGVAEGAQARIEGASVTGAQLNAEEAGRKEWFTVPVEAAGQPVGLDFRGRLVAGSVGVELVAPDGEVVWEFETEKAGPFVANTVVRPEKLGDYQLSVVWEGPVQAQYSLQWKPGEIQVATVSPLALLGGLGMVAVAVGFVIYALVRRLGPRYLALGALAWAVTVALKFLWAIPLNPPVQRALFDTLPAGIASLLFYVYVGLLTGIFEVALVWLVMRYTRLGRVRWEQALSFGIGFGAIEALLLGANSLLSVVITLVAPTVYPPELLGQLARLNDVLYGLAPIVERLAVVLVHTFCNVLIFYGVASNRSRWFWLALVFKSALDTVAAFGQFWDMTVLWKLWTIEAVIVLFGIVGWMGTRWVAERYPAKAIRITALADGGSLE